MANAIEQATVAVSVTPDDSNDLARKGAALYIGVTGDVEVHMADDDSDTAIVFKNVPVGFMPVQVDRVLATNTTATEILALYE